MYSIVSFVSVYITIYVCFICINKPFCKVAKLLEDSKHTKCPLDSNNKLNKSATGPWVAHLRRNVYKSGESIIPSTI